MCLKYNAAATTRMRKRLDRQGQIVCYKYYEVATEARLLTPFFPVALAGPGLVKSSRARRKRPLELSREEVRHGRVCHGIHVCRTRPRKGTIRSDWVIVPVRCRKEDFVAAGCEDDAVFVRVEVSERAFAAAKSMAKKMWR